MIIDKFYFSKTGLVVFSIFVSLFFKFTQAQSLDTLSLEKKIFQLNNDLKYQESEKLLLDVINSNSSNKEKFKASVLLSNTFKRVFDYQSTEKYLQQAETFSSNQNEANEVKSLLAMALFDQRKYKEAKKVMDYVKSQNFKGVNLENLSILKMQEGYLHFLNKNYTQAEVDYNHSLEIMDSVKSCNDPIVYGKMLLLYHDSGKKDLIEKLYQKGMDKAEKCDILKYKIYLTEEYLKTFNNDDYRTTLKYKNKLDSLNLLYNASNNLSELHNLKEDYTNKELKKEEKNNTVFSGVIFALLAALGIITFFLVKTYKRRKILEKEYQEIKKTFDFYANNLTPVEENRLEELLEMDLFSARQKEILDMLLHGFNNQEIADKLYISENTVKFHVKNIYKIMEQNNVKFERYKKKKSKSVEDEG